ncbi:MAG TPA: MFS transporter [Planctomycetota bacterium]|nr:MFS transporter [Planctomycetota bacterium]
MNQVWIITGVVACFGLGNGLLLNATPQVSLALKLSSRELGLIGAGIPIGYSLSCLLAGRFLSGMTGRTVLRCGLAVTFIALLCMAQARSAAVCVAAQIGFGLGSGAVWPFSSAWLLDLESHGIPRTRLLRYYNVAWTSSTACGMFAGGLLCSRQLIFEAIYAAAVMILCAFVFACIGKPTPPHANSHGSSAAAQMRPANAMVLLAAALICNITVLATRMIVWNNYAELNSARGFGADRMGLISGMSLVAQVGAFTFGYMYEHKLGLRRVYLLLSAALVAINLTFAYAESLPLLLAAVLIHGVVLAIAFQTALLAAMRFFPSPRSATTFHEAVIGIAGLSPLMAGYLVAAMKERTSDLQALQAPFLVLAGLAVVGLLVETLLVGKALSERVFLAPVSPPETVGKKEAVL